MPPNLVSNNPKAVLHPAPAPQATAAPQVASVPMPKPDTGQRESISGRVSPLVLKKTDKADAAPPKNDANKKADKPDGKPPSPVNGASLVTAAAATVKKAMEGYFHVDHRLRKWPVFSFSKPEVHNQRIQGESSLNKKVEAFNKALPALVELILKKAGEPEGISKLVKALQLPKKQEAKLMKAITASSAHLEAFNLKTFLATAGPKMRAFAARLSAMDLNAMYETLPGPVRLLLKTSSGTAAATGAALDKFPLFEDKATQAAFKKHMVQLVEQICGPLTAAMKEDYHYLIQVVVIRQIYAILDTLQKLSESGKNVDDPQVVLQVVQAHLDEGIKILGKVAFDGKAEDVAKALPKVMEALFKPLRDLKEFALNLGKGANQAPLAGVPDSYWDKLKGNKDLPELDLLVESVKQQYKEAVKGLETVDQLKAFRRQMQLTIAKIGLGVDMGSDLKELQTALEKLKEVFAKLGASPFYRIFKTLSKEYGALTCLAPDLKEYRELAEYIKAGDAKGKIPNPDDVDRLRALGAKIESQLQAFQGAIKGKTADAGGILLPTMKAVYLVMTREMEAILKKHTISLSAKAS